MREKQQQGRRAGQKGDEQLTHTAQHSDQDSLDMAWFSEDEDPAEELPDPVGGKGADARPDQDRLKSFEKTDPFYFADEVSPFPGFNAPVKDHQQEDDHHSTGKPRLRNFSAKIFQQSQDVVLIKNLFVNKAQGNHKDQ